MAMLFFDDCGDHYQTGTFNNGIVGMYWASIAGNSVSNQPNVSTTAGRSGYGLNLGETGVYVPNIAIPADGTTNCILGFACYISSYSNSDSFILLNSWGVKIGITPAAAVAITLPSNVGIATTASGVFPWNTWCYLELKVNSLQSGGNIVTNYTVRLNEVVILTGSATGSGTTGTLHTIFIGDQNVHMNTFYMDDFYCCDSTGSAPCNDFLGDCIVEAHFVTGAGFTTNGTPNGAASDYLCVNETSPDLDTTYVAFASAGNIDTYAINTASVLSTMYAVAVCSVAKQDIGSNHTVAAGLAETGPTYQLGATFGIPTVNYTGNYLVFSTNPFTSSAWALGDLANIQPTFKVIS